MVDIDRGPDWHDLLAQLIAGQYGRAERVDALTDATHDRDAAITANYLVDQIRNERTIHIDIPDDVSTDVADEFDEALATFILDQNWTDLGAFVHSHSEACEHSDHCYGPGSKGEAEVIARLGIDAKLAELAALGWAVKKAKGRGEVEVLIANLEADAHRTQHEEETT